MSKSRSKRKAATLQLPAILDIKAAEPLKRELLAARGQPATIDASAVQRMGGLGLQVLLSAQATWEADGQALRFAGATEAFCESLSLFGANELLDLGGTL